jgi:hypothetical protein
LVGQNERLILSYNKLVEIDAILDDDAVDVSAAIVHKYLRIRCQTGFGLLWEVELSHA